MCEQEKQTYIRIGRELCYPILNKDNEYELDSIGYAVTIVERHDDTEETNIQHKALTFEEVLFLSRRKGGFRNATVSPQGVQIFDLKGDDITDKVRTPIFNTKRELPAYLKFSDAFWNKLQRLEATYSTPTEIFSMFRPPSRVELREVGKAMVFTFH